MEKGINFVTQRSMLQICFRPNMNENIVQTWEKYPQYKPRTAQNFGKTLRAWKRLNQFQSFPTGITDCFKCL